MNIIIIGNVLKVSSVENMVQSIEKYITVLSTSQHDTYTNPFENISPNLGMVLWLLRNYILIVKKIKFAISYCACNKDSQLCISVIGLDIVTPDSRDQLFSSTADVIRQTTERVILPDISEFLQISSSGSNHHELSSPLISFPKYNNYMQNKNKFWCAFQDFNFIKSVRNKRT